MRKLAPVLLVMASLIVALTAIPLLANGLSEVARFTPADGELPEGLVVDQKGNIYASMALAGVVQKITPDGEVSLFANLPGPGSGFMLGMAFDRNGNLYVAISSFDPATHGVWRVNRDGSEVEQFAPLLTSEGEADGLPNGMVFDKKGNLYVSDSIGGKVWTIDRQGDVSVWKADPLLQGIFPNPLLPFPVGVDGIVFDKKEKNLYAANFDSGWVVRIPVGKDGSAGEAEVFVDDPLIVGIDGMTFDDDGNLYGAINTQDRVVMISEDGEISVLADLADGDSLQNPADVKFGRGKDKDTLYIANFAIFRALGIMPGDPNPSLVKMLVEDNHDGDEKKKHKDKD